MRKKVLMLIEGVIPAIGGGGAENQVITLCKELQKDYDCLIVAPMVSFGIQQQHDSFAGIDIYRIPYPKIKIIGKLILLLKLALYLLKERNNYQILHAHIAGSMSAITSLMGYLLNKLVIVKMTGWTEVDKGILSDNYRYRLSNVFNRSCIKLTTHAQATSIFISNNLKRFGFNADQILYLPNAVDTDKYKPVRSKIEYRNDLDIQQLNNEDIVGIYVGRLEPEKGIYDFLKQWCEQEKPAKHKLIIIGRGRLHESIAQLVNEYNLTERVLMLGAQSDINRFTLASDYGVLPSMHEGLSNTLLEYMASALPVIGTRVSGTEDMISSGDNGWIYNYGDIDGLNHILVELFDSDKIALSKLGEHSRELITSKASIPVVINKIKEIYRES